MGGSKKTTQTSSQTTSAPQYLQPFYQDAASAANTGYNNLMANYPTDTVAGFSDDTNTALGMIRDRATAGSAVQQAGNQNYLDTINGNYLNADSNPYLQSYMDAVNRSTTSQFRDSTMPGLQSAYAGAGRYGSNAYNTQIANSQQALAQALSDSNATIGFNNYNAERGRQFSAATNAPAMAAADYQDANALNAAGVQQQEQAQNEITGDINRLQYMNSDAIADYVNLLNGIRGQDGTTYGTTTGKTSGGGFADTLSAITGAAGALTKGYQAIKTPTAPSTGANTGTSAAQLATLAALFSDKRLKRNISRIGSYKGYNAYMYQYLWSDEPRVGVMAQEVEQVNPAAVITRPDGYKMVNYGAL